MKTNKKKSLFLMLPLTCALALSACSGGSTPAGTEAPKPEDPKGATTNTAPPKETALYEVSLQYPGVPQKAVAAVEAEANKYLASQNIGATLKINAIDWGQWDQKLNLMIASGEKSDIIFTAAWQNYTVNVAKGAFLDIGELLKSDGKDIVANLDSRFLEGSKIGGKNYGVPTNKELAATRGVIVRKDLADKYKMDLTAVKTWEDLEPLFKIIKENEPTITPFYNSNANNGNGLLDNLDWDYLGDASVPGVIRKIGKETKVMNALETPEYLEKAKLARKWYLAGYINKDAATSTVFPRDQAKAGKAFAFTDGLKPGKAAEEQGYIGFPLEQIDLTQPTITTGDASGAMLAISKTSKNPKLAMQIINLLHKDPVFNNLINFGIEGKHYVKVSDKIIKNGPEAEQYNPGAQWQLGNQFLNFLKENEDPKKWELYKSFNDKGVASPSFGFAFNSQPVKTEIAAYTTLNEQYHVPLTTGSVDPDKMIAEFLEKQKKAGVDKIIAEKQKQLDEFLAQKK
ncbi:ABC transporter substrate-binding protein [Paenibacillus puerhi]|uniref:ABC transporter substrate-binding protein n=1 Tax=Paenibacillus puerhi TaxID=2692622 RepID=UPI001F3D2688|nr:ABC transporter substrate-binding protein [Paenibacillus puerhi]